MAPLKRRRRARRDRAKEGLLAPRGSRQPGPETYAPATREGDRAAYGYARAQGGEVGPPGLSECGMRCMGAWSARGTREGVQVTASSLSLKY